MKKVLLTGFTPFGKFKLNPSGEIVKRLKGKTIRGYKIIGLIAPVVFGRAGQIIIKAIQKHNPDIIISMGLDAKSPVIAIEKIGLNIHAGIDNVKTKLKSEFIIKNGPPAYFTDLPAERIVKELRESNIPANISYHAGVHLCNEVTYTIRHYITTKRLNVKSGFVHMPCLPEQVAKDSVPAFPSMPLELILKAVKIVIESLSDNG